MSLDTVLIISVIALFIMLFFLYKKISEIGKPNDNPALVEWLKQMQASLDTTNKTLHESLSSNSTNMVKTLQENTKQLNERLDRAAQVIAGVGKEVSVVGEIGRSMKELQDFLKSPKMRGNIGEQILKDLISQIFPKNSFHLQYRFKSGEKVDAAIKTDAGIIPIDSKFPLENYQRLSKHQIQDNEFKLLKKTFINDIKKHIDAIAQKYILPDEGTMDFALMYIPSESVFYEIINMEELIDYARGHRVYMVSPSTLYAHLQTILLSFEGKKIEQESKEILRLLRSIQIDYSKVNDQLDLLGRHLGNASNQYSNVHKGFVNFGQKLESVKQIATEDSKQLKID